jgi:hypothetical protein
MIALHDNCLLLDGVRSSGIAFRKQKLGKHFNFEKQDIKNCKISGTLLIKIKKSI